MSKALSYLPADIHTVTVTLTVNGAAECIEFLKRAFDAVEVTRSQARDGRLLNACVRIADSAIMLNNVFPEFGAKPTARGERYV